MAGAGPRGGLIRPRPPRRAARTAARIEPAIERPALAASAIAGDAESPDAPAAGDGRREPALDFGPPNDAGPEREGPAPPRRDSLPARIGGPAGSLALHGAAAVLMLLGGWMPRPPDIVPIPVKLVFQPPPPAKAKPVPEAKRSPEARPPPGRLASEEIGDTNPKHLGPKDIAAPEAEKPPAAPPAPATPSPPAPKTALLDLPPPARPVPPEAAIPRPPPKPKPPRQAERRHAPAHEPVRRVTRLAKYPGPSATRSEYLAYITTLTRQHLDLLPPSVIAGRQGATVLSIQVLDDGTIALIRVAQSSGYPDIDRRVEDMIVAVGRFPPVPQWFQGERMDLKFILRFPFLPPR